MTFLDDGCSDCVMWEGVPGIQWEGVVTKKCPFNIVGVAGLAPLTRNEWTNSCVVFPANESLH